MPCSVDEAQTTRLAAALARVLREHQVRRMAELGGADRQIVLEQLNAIAVNVAIMIAATGNDPECRKFFDDALAMNVDSAAAWSGVSTGFCQ